MEELIKIAPNGQWTLEKGRSNEEQQRLIEQFIADKRRQAEARQAQGNKPVPQEPHPLESLQPVKHLTGEGEAGTKEQVEAKRRHLRAAEAAAEAAAKQKRDALAAKNRPDPIVSSTPHQPSPRAQAAYVAATNPQNDAGTAADIEAAQRAQSRKAAWQATTEFLANQGGNRGMRAIAEAGQQRAQLDQRQKNIDAGIKPSVAPKTKQEVLPPQELYVDEKTGARSMRTRQGRFHGEGATTTGKIVDTNFFYKEKDPVTGEEKMKRAVRPQVQKHIHSWNDQTKQWDHVKTVLGNPDPTKG